ncbi:MAG: hypothetical protein QXW09_06640 [Thermoproteota archaeon]
MRNDYRECRGRVSIPQPPDYEFQHLLRSGALTLWRSSHLGDPGCPLRWGTLF